MRRQAFYVAVIILTGSLAFGLGRLSKLEESKSNLVIEQSAQALGGGVAAVNPGVGKGLLVASKSGTRYYLATCAGADRISEKNKIWFNSITEAKQAGYAPAANCQGI